MKTYIYSLTDPIDNQIKYIGKSNNPHKRYYNHIGDVKKGFKNKKCNWLRKLLNENKKPILQILEECDDNNWQERETYWITKINPRCNHYAGGNGSTHISAEKTSKIVLQFDLDNNLIKEYPSINEAARQTGLELANISNACNGKLNHTGLFIWKIKGENKEFKNKTIKQKRIVLQMDKNYKIISEYNSILEASQLTGVPRTSISNCCFYNIEKTYNSSYGFIWKFKEKLNKI